MGIDPILTPTLYTLATFVGQTLELGLKLPVETVLRRGQLNVVCAESRSEELQTIVEVGPYRGLFGTLHHIVYDEGESEVSTDAGRTTEARALKLGKSAQQRQKRKGQGFEGLWRGWRVGMWGIVGVWGAATLGGVGGKGGEF